MKQIRLPAKIFQRVKDMYQPSNTSGFSQCWTGEGIFSRIKAERERDNGSIRKYVTVASERSNEESGKKAEPGGFGLYDQVTKRTRWMPWRQKAMKDV